MLLAKSLRLAALKRGHVCETQSIAAVTTLADQTSDTDLPPDFGAAIFHYAAAGIAVIDRGALIIEANPALARMSGYAVDELRTMSVQQITHPDDVSIDRGLVAEVIEGNRADYQVEKRYIHRTGRIIWGRLTVSSLKYSGREGRHLLAIVEDITASKEANEALARERAHFERLFASVPEGVALVDRDDTVLRINPEFTRLFGYASGEAVGRRLGELIVPEGKGEEALAVTRRIVTGKRVRLDVVRRHRNGDAVDVGVVGAPVRLANGDVAVYAIYRDIRERKSLERALRRVSTTDELTGALNRRGFLSLAGREWRLARRRGASVMLIYCDIDHFKAINDAHGHAEGDRLLKDVANLIRASMRATDVVARLGGDEFVALAVEGNDDPVMVGRVRAAIRQFNEEQDRPYELSMSIGSVSVPARSASSLDGLLAEADQRMYDVKRARRSSGRT